MKTTHKQNLIAAALVGTVVIGGIAPQALAKEARHDKQALQERTVERRAVEAAIWGMPVVSQEAMRQAYFRDAKAKYNDIIWWPNGSDWKNQSTTANTSVPYIYYFFNTRVDGPVVVEVPPSDGSTQIMGTLVDAWQVPLFDIGAQGEDKGAGAKYLILPPDFTGDVPAGYIPVRSSTYNGGSLTRTVAAGNSVEDARKGMALAQRIRIYPLAAAANPPKQRFVDMTDVLYEGIVRFDETLYTSLARVLNEEPVQPRDLPMMGMLRSLGIEKGKTFQPDTKSQARLKTAAREAHAWLMENQVTWGVPYWPDRKWDTAVSPIAAKTKFTWGDANFFDVDARGIAFYIFFSPPKNLGAGSFYLTTFLDADGQRLRGENTYRLRVPPDVPVNQYWALTVYNHETSALFRETANVGLDSWKKDLRKNADGSVDIYLGPKPPAGHASNWIYTAPGKGWFPYFRFYGPEKPLFEKTWKLENIEKVK